MRDARNYMPQEWICVHDRIPPSHVDVLVLGTFGHSFGYYDADDDEWRTTGGKVIDPDYWYPLPKDPAQEPT